MPPYVVFHDTTLRELARLKPTTRRRAAARLRHRRAQGRRSRRGDSRGDPRRPRTVRPCRRSSNLRRQPYTPTASARPIPRCIAADHADGFVESAIIGFLLVHGCRGHTRQGDPILIHARDPRTDVLVRHRPELALIDQPIALEQQLRRNLIACFRIREVLRRERQLRRWVDSADRIRFRVAPPRAGSSADG